MKYYAVIDTNVLVSYLLTRRNDSSVALVIPKNGHVVSPAEMLQIIHLAESKGNTVCEPPMEYVSEKKRQIIEKGWQAIEKIRLCAEQNGLSDLPLESINQIIREYRAERKKQI
ncbi:MAG: hypothetical protein MJY68_00590 [Bacteroidaceae bacterium]|nr:hypothetical protein [Bacteroidaceae bacterium]